MAEKDLKFGKRLEHYLVEAGFSKKRLADETGVSPSAVGTYINEGRIPEAPILLKIARLLNKSMEELLTGNEAIPGVSKSQIDSSGSSTLDDKLIKLFHSLPVDSKMGLLGIFNTYVNAIKGKEGEEAQLAYDDFKKSFIKEVKKTD